MQYIPKAAQKTPRMGKPIIICHFISNLIERLPVSSKKMGMFLELFFSPLPCSFMPVMKFHRKENINVFISLSEEFSAKHYYLKFC